MSQSKKKSAVVFDWDGTLFDSATFKRDNFIRLFETWGAPRASIELLHKKYTGLPRKVLVASVYRDLFSKTLDDRGFETFSEEYSRLNLISAQTARLFPDTLQVLEGLKDSHFLFVSSSTPPDELEKVVETLKVDKKFQEVLGSKEGFGKGKEHFSYLREKYQLSLKDLLFVGDDDQDGILAKEAGVDFIQVGEGKTLKRIEKAIALKFQRLPGAFA